MIGEWNESIEILESRINAKLENEYGIIPTKIYALNIDVDNENQKSIDELNETKKVKLKRKLLGD